MNNKLLSSSFLYVDEEDTAVYKVEYFADGTFRYMLKGRGNRYKEGIPNAWMPYNLHAIAQAPADQVIYFCGSEEDADALTEMELLATCGVPNVFGGEAPEQWRKYFAGRCVLYVQSCAPTTKEICLKAYNQYSKEHAESLAIVLEDIEDGESTAEWLRRKEWGRFQWQEYVYRKIEEIANAAIERQKALPPAPAEFSSNGDGHKDDAQADKCEKYEMGWKPFPLHCLPDPIQDYCRVMAESIKVDPTYIALPALVFAAGLIGNSRLVRINPTWPEPSVLFGCLIADSSTRKSPAMDWAVRPLMEMEFDFAKDFKTKLDCWNVKSRAWTDSSQAEPAQSSQQFDETAPKKPVRKRLLISDITVETIIRELEHNPRGLILKRDELRAWFASFGRYKSGGQAGADLSFWLEAIRASGYIYDRKSGDQTTVVIPRCAISVYGTIQPSVIAKVFNRDYFDSGFVSRMLLAMPPKRAGRWDHYQPDPEVIDRYERLMLRLQGLDWEYTQDPDNKPRELIFTEEADQIWGQWYNPWQEQQYHAEGDIASLMAKLEGCCGRFALIFAVCDFLLGKTDTEHVNGLQVQRAIELAEWFKEEAMRIYAFVGMTDIERETENLLQKIKDKGGYITARELFLNNKSKYRDQNRASTYLWGLVNAGKLLAVDRIPGKHCPVRTTFFTTHTTQLR